MEAENREDNEEQEVNIRLPVGLLKQINIALKDSNNGYESLVDFFKEAARNVLMDISEEQEFLVYGDNLKKKQED